MTPILHSCRAKEDNIELPEFDSDFASHSLTSPFSERKNRDIGPTQTQDMRKLTVAFCILIAMSIIFLRWGHAPSDRNNIPLGSNVATYARAPLPRNTAPSIQPTRIAPAEPMAIGGSPLQPPFSSWAHLGRTFPALSAEDPAKAPSKEILIKLYRAEVPGFNKRQLGWALSFYQGADVEKAYTEAVLSTTGKVSPEGLASLTSALYTLGFSAHDSDKAFNLLKEGIDPSFWADKILWTPEDSRGRSKEF
jgi:hypothetical protein